MKGLRNLVATTLALFLMFSLMGNSSSAPQRIFERRNWTPQAMLYLKGAQGRRFISDQSRRKDLSDRQPLERRSPDPQPLTRPEAAALLLASFQKPQEGSWRKVAGDVFAVGDPLFLAILKKKTLIKLDS